MIRNVGGDPLNGRVGLELNDCKTAFPSRRWPTVNYLRFGQLNLLVAPFSAGATYTILRLFNTYAFLSKLSRNRAFASVERTTFVRH